MLDLRNKHRAPARRWLGSSWRLFHERRVILQNKLCTDEKVLPSCFTQRCINMTEILYYAFPAVSPATSLPGEHHAAETPRKQELSEWQRCLKLDRLDVKRKLKTLIMIKQKVKFVSRKVYSFLSYGKKKKKENAVLNRLLHGEKKNRNTENCQRIEDSENLKPYYQTSYRNQRQRKTWRKQRRERERYWRSGGERRGRAEGRRISDNSNKSSSRLLSHNHSLNRSAAPLSPPSPYHLFPLPLSQLPSRPLFVSTKELLPIPRHGSFASTINAVLDKTENCDSAWFWVLEENGFYKDDNRVTIA